MPNIWLRVTGLSGAAAVALGAIGAHALIKKSDSMKVSQNTLKQTNERPKLEDLPHLVYLFN